MCNIIDVIGELNEDMLNGLVEHYGILRVMLIKNKRSKRKVNIYTDGACSKNPGPGGYGVILEYKGHEVELSGGSENTTNNQMELMGVITGLEALKEPCDVTIVTDSKYIADSFNKGWIDSWQKKSWKKSDGKAVLNKELWQRL